MNKIGHIGDIFKKEDLFRKTKLSGEQIKKLTGPIHKRIHRKMVINAECKDYSRRTDEEGCQHI